MDAFEKTIHFMTTVWVKLTAARAYVNIVISDVFRKYEAVVSNTHLDL